MPDLNQDLEHHQLFTNHFGFSAERIDSLDSSEYTLATLLVDTSSSTLSFRDDIKKCVDKVIGACSKSPRKDNLMLRVCEFNSSFNEVHGFKKLSTIAGGDYDSNLKGGGMTALFDAAENAVEATSVYGKNLSQNDYQVNGIVFIITDGADNISKATPDSVNQALKACVKSEFLESINTVLIGLNIDSGTDVYLQTFKNEAGISQYINIGDATPGNLAKLADFVSRSISSTSQSLGTGGPSQSLNF